jgi:CreA protein
MNRLLFRYGVMVLMTTLLGPHAPARAADEPDLIFKRSTVFKWLTPNDKLATYGLDDPEVDGVACHFTVPEKGGFKGWIGVAEEVSDISLACHQIGPIRIKAKFEQGRTYSASADRCSSRRCRLCAAAMSSATFWSTWCIPTA